MVRAFVFDIGNVLLGFDFAPSIRLLSRHIDFPVEEVMPRIESLKNACESGTTSRREFIDQAIAAIGFRGSVDEFTRVWQEIFTLNEANAVLVARLAPRYPLYLLSNTSDLHVEYFTRRFDVFARFRDAVYSHEAKCMKPAEEIYRIAIDRFGLDPAGTVFIDDLEPNIATAKRLGFLAHHYHAGRHEELLSFLDALGVET